MKRYGYILIIVLVAALSLYVRTAGLFRGVTVDYSFHSDEPKQVQAFGYYLQGKYIWYRDHPMHDGYPLFLAHFDEWFVRPIRGVQKLIHDYLVPESRMAAYPVSDQLYFYARSLRVIYGCLLIWFTYLIARKIRYPREAAFAAAAFVGLSPLAASVCHFATGDLGTDFFAALSLLCLGMHWKRPKAIWLWLSGIATAFCFASKYNGALIGLVTMVYLVGITKFTWRGIRSLIANGLHCFIAFILGVVIAMPQFVFAGKRTWKDLRVIFEFIKNYHVPQKVIELPAGERAVLSFQENIPYLLPHFGYFVVGLAAVGMAIAVVRAASLWAKKDQDLLELRKRLLTAGICIFPFAALTISLAGKFRVKPFHFSYLEFVFCLAAAYLLGLLWKSRRFVLQLAACALFLATLGELGVQAEKEAFFWGKEDHKYLALSYCFNVFEEEDVARIKKRSTPSARAIKQLFLDPDNPANFRNRPMNVISERGPYWNEIKYALVPTVPFPTDHHWIFANGPVFPRNDRTFVAPFETATRRHIVLFDPPSKIWLGLRSGSYPVSADIKAGGVKNEVNLGANEQKLIEVKPECWRRIKGAWLGEKDAYLIPLKVSPDIGTLYVTVMTEKEQVDLFQIFGGVGTENSLEWITDITQKKYTDHINETRYLDRNIEEVITEDDRRPLQTFPQGAPLPAGRYTASVEVFPLEAGCALTLSLGDMLGLSEHLKISENYSFETAEYTTVTFSFRKPFAPYECTVIADCTKGRVKLGKITIKPDADKLLDDLKELAKTKQTPPWMKLNPGSFEVPSEGNVTGARLGRLFELETVNLPLTLIPGETFDTFARLYTIGAKRKHVKECEIFIHIENEEGKQVFAYGMPVQQASFSAAPMYPQPRTLPADIPPGEYTVYTGIWNTRTRLRLPVTSNWPDTNGSEDDKLRLGTIQILSDKP